MAVCGVFAETTRPIFCLRRPRWGAPFAPTPAAGEVEGAPRSREGSDRVPVPAFAREGLVPDGRERPSATRPTEATSPAAGLRAVVLRVVVVFFFSGTLLDLPFPRDGHGPRDPSAHPRDGANVLELARRQLHAEVEQLLASRPQLLGQVLSGEAPQILLLSHSRPPPRVPSRCPLSRRRASGSAACARPAGT